MNGCGKSSGGGENSAGTSVSDHSFYRDGHIASIRGSGVAMRRSSVHEAQSTHESNSSHNKRGDSRGKRGLSVRRRADGFRRGTGEGRTGLDMVMMMMVMVDGLT